MHYKLILVKKVITKVKKMNHNAGSCKIIRFKPQKNTAEELSEFAESFFEVVSVDYVDDKEQLTGYMKENISEKKMIEAAEKAGIKLPEYKSEILSSDNWLADNVIQFAPVEVADFLVYGIHEKNVELKDKIGIKVYAATAFGSEHQTTKNCLQAIADIKKNGFEPQRILDVGTGSGILALAAAKIWAKADIVAVDIDEESVAVAMQNAVDNQVAEHIKTAYSDGYKSDIVKKNAPYDLIFANILARPLIDMAKDMAKNLRIGGYAVISGFIDNQTDWVLDEHKKYGLQLQKLYEADNWRAALLKRV